MGVFDVMCQASGIVLDGRTRLVFLAEDTATPLLPPIEGTYDRYGKIEAPLPGPALDAARALAAATDRSFDDLLDDAFEGEVPFAGGLVRYALVDDGVYRGLVATVASGGVPTVRPDVLAWLEALPFAELASAAVHPGSRTLLDPWREDERLRHDLVALALFRHFPELTLGATTVDSPSDQYLYFHEHIAKKHGYAGAETETKEARKRFAAYPLVLAAIEENTRAWIARES